MRTFFIALMLVTSLVVFTNKATAQSRTEKFPYDAIIADDEVYARSGPGIKPYYPTSRLRKGDHVTVIRHDHGGWFMIEPPPGSFAWVRQEYVNRQGDRGVITGDSQVVAWVGTSFGDDHSVEQRRLQPGETVEILSEKTLRDERGEIAYFRIRSPKGHFRWIPGSKIVTSEKQLVAPNTRTRAEDPVADGNVSRVDLASLEPSSAESAASSSSAVGQSAPAQKELGRRPAPTPRDLDEDIASSSSPASPSASPKKESGLPSSLVTMDANGQQRLAAIDEQMKELLQRNTHDWDFTAIEAELQALQAQESTSTGAARRLASLGKYKRIKADYDDFASIMAKTNQRDAELAAAQQRLQPGGPNRAAATPRPQSPPRPQPPTPSNNRQPPPTRSPVPGNSPASNNSATKNGFRGAGIIQRSGATQPGAPKFVLLHPNGQRLAYLQGEGVDLGRYVGEPMGLAGERYYRSDLKSDFMVVKSLQPVKLKP
ncbi:MAG: SH3 domain-containing protein [Planctomycetaceae bacterium]